MQFQSEMSNLNFKSQISDLRWRRAARQLARHAKCRYIAERATAEHILSSTYNTAPLSLDRISTYPLAGRKSKVSVREFARPHRKGARLPEFLDSLPRILAAEDLRAMIDAILMAHARGKESRGYAIIEHHEIMMPLVAAALVESPRPRRTAK
jgi:hypothetical protein